MDHILTIFFQILYLEIVMKLGKEPYREGRIIAKYII